MIRCKPALSQLQQSSLDDPTLPNSQVPDKAPAWKPNLQSEDEVHLPLANSMLASSPCNSATVVRLRRLDPGKRNVRATARQR
mmetsp:Transcript_29476/g.71679  ORF Transcript_29476/g.71679 Transcript_29476/m.71679 type:complete len:83 (-) Transcript_29476:427-675(-)